MTSTPELNPGTGIGTQATAPAAESIVIIRDFQPGQLVRIVFITPEQAKQLPDIPTNALQIAIAPAGGI